MLDEDDEVVDKHYINNVVSDMVSDLLYYNRKEDDTLPRGKIEDMVKTGELTVDDVVEMFRVHLMKGLK